YGITIVPLATATAVNFTAPLFATMAAALILHEDVRLRRWIAVVIGFVGVLVIMRPGRESLDAMLLLILLSAASSAMNNITVKYLVRTERPNTIVALFSEEHTSELQSPCNLVCRLLLEKKKYIICNGTGSSPSPPGYSPIPARVRSLASSPPTRLRSAFSTSASPSVADVIRCDRRPRRP